MANTTLTQTGAQVQAILDKADKLPSTLGTAGQVLTMNAGATAPEWQTPSGGGGTQLYKHTFSLQIGQLTTIQQMVIINDISTSYTSLNDIFHYIGAIVINELTTGTISNPQTYYNVIITSMVTNGLLYYYGVDANNAFVHGQASYIMSDYVTAL